MKEEKKNIVRDAIMYVGSCIMIVLFFAIIYGNKGYDKLRRLWYDITKTPYVMKHDKFGYYPQRVHYEKDRND